MCVIHDRSITIGPFCALCVLGTPNILPRIVLTNNTAEKYDSPFDGYVYLEN
jgi:hypothetical protein